MGGQPSWNRLHRYARRSVATAYIPAVNDSSSIPRLSATQTPCGGFLSRRPPRCVCRITATLLNTAPATRFRAQAAKWIESLPTRRRKPVKPATVANWQHALDKWVLPTLGDKFLGDVSNGALRELVEKMAAVGLSAKTIVNYSQVVKLVVASAVDSDGEQIYPRKWNHEFCEMPIIDPTTQHRPTVTRAEVESIIGAIIPRYKVLVALLAGTGLRIGEALGVKVTDLGPECRVLRVRRSIWQGKEQEPKTPNAVREIDLPESLAQLLREYAANKSGYLFATSSGCPLAQRNVLRALHATGKKIGLHSFRRFRTETLRRACARGFNNAVARPFNQNHN